MFEPRFTSGKVNAIIPSGRPGEFIVARSVYRRGVPASESDPTGLMVSTIQIH
jgi:hypothetical protein